MPFGSYDGEHVDRGVYPQRGTGIQCMEIFTNYIGNYVFDNDLWGHEADGRSPWERLEVTRRLVML